jgi:hypothetical protein
MPDVVTSLITDPARMFDLHARTLAWWESKCSEGAVAEYMAQSLSRPHAYTSNGGGTP